MSAQNTSCHLTDKLAGLPACFQDVLLQLQLKRPDAMLHFDLGLLRRIAGLQSQCKQMAAVNGVARAVVPPDWQHGVRDCTKWLMGSVSKALREMS